MKDELNDWQCWYCERWQSNERRAFVDRRYSDNDLCEDCFIELQLT